MDGEAVPPAVARHLQPDERVLWWGRPRQGLVVRPRDVVVSALSAAWGLVFLALVLYSGGAFGLVLAPLLLTGVAMAVGRFHIEEHQRRHAFYAITTRRVLFVGWRWLKGRHVRSILLTTTLYPRIRRAEPDEGEIDFKGTAWRRGWFELPHNPWAFSMIERPTKVLEIYTRAAADAQSAAWRAASGR